MCCDKLNQFTAAGKKFFFLILGVVMIVSCQSAGRQADILEFTERKSENKTLALRFAPRLFVHPDEPFDVISIIPVLHPERPFIAYHIFFAEEVMKAGRGKEVDHEVMWIEYDPVTYKIADVTTLWHRTVLRTDSCLLDAKTFDQRPAVYAQWGQHGILPKGWKELRTMRPYSELQFYYSTTDLINSIPNMQKTDSPILFEGSFEDYINLSKEVDVIRLIKDQKIIVAEHCSEELLAIVQKTFSIKKDWPFW